MTTSMRCKSLLVLWLCVSGVSGGGAVSAESELRISEFMAANSSLLTDPQGRYSDWVEIHNAGSAAVDLGGMLLTDDFDAPARWQIPTGQPQSTMLPPGGRILLWLNAVGGAAGLYAPFELASAGEQIALFDADGTLLDAVEFDEQRPNVSYGRPANAPDTWGYLVAPTPGAANAGAFGGMVADTKFSHDRGFYTEPFAVTITSKTPDATIFYTVDGSSPLDVDRGFPTGRPYTGPIPISTTTCLRAVAYRQGWLSSDVDTQTYLFLDDVITQATHPATSAQITPPGYPSSWGGVQGDYQMDPDVVGQNGADIFGGLYAETIREDLKAVPIVSLVMDIDDWFGNRGIYINKSQDGTERVASIEIFDAEGTYDVQVNCALAMQGGVSGGGTSLNRWKAFKLSMRPRFKPQTDDGKLTGGPAKLDERLFPDSPVRSHNTIVLDAVLNHSWHHPSGGQRNTAKFVQDQYVADLHNAMGGHSPHGWYAHVYINGLYWGMYWVHERPDHAWAAEMFGGNEDEYDAIKHNAGGVINSGTTTSATANFNSMLNAANAVASNPGDMARYQILCDMLDVDNFITYLLANWYTGNHDWPHKNWYATHHTAPDGKWRIHSWDAEHVLEGGNDVGDSPVGLHDRLKGNAEYRLRFADLIHQAFFNGGPLSYPATADRYRFRMDQVERALVGESARWGDNRQSHPHPQQDWLATQNALLTGFFPSRSDQVLSRLRSANLYPNVDAPVFRVSGSPQHGGSMEAGEALSMTTAGGTVWYTLDGSDPRTPGSAPEPPEMMVLVPENAAKRVLVPTGPVAETWKSSLSFVDSDWRRGSGGVGYERSSSYAQYIDVDVEDAMYGGNTTCYIRVPFGVPAATLDGLAGLILRMRYDDGFIAYLNGVEVARAVAGGVSGWNASASGSHSDGEAVLLQPFNISSHLDALREGANLLAIHGLNQSSTSSDFLISLQLVGSKASEAGPVEAGTSPTAVRYTGPISLPESTRIRARTLEGGTWSALNEAIFAVGPVAENLRISEIMYHPADDPNSEFIELTNVGTESINLNLVRFTDGIEYTFDSFELSDGGYCLLVRDRVAFEARYGVDLPVVGQYEGSLNNAGERIELVDAAGQVIQSFQYDDDWYPLTDGLGSSLTVRHPSTSDSQSLSDKATWAVSSSFGGSPGTGGSVIGH